MRSILPYRPVVALLGGLLCSTVAFGQADDDLDDILGSGDPMVPESAREEREALIEEDERPETKLPDEDDSKRFIKTLQKKTFLKLGRYEAAPHLGFVTSDPFINRYLVGASFAYHITEIFAIEGVGTFSPDFGRADWKPITEQIIDENQVTPDISKIQYYGNINFQYSPIYGKVALMGKNIIMFDVFGTFGTGFVNTRDDLEALQKEGEEIAVNTEVQMHPTLNFGGGARVILSEGFALRVEGRGLSYIEVLESTTLEMKNNMMLLVSASFFFPGMEK
jgi:outer membrane beta-barrel protein